MSNSMMPSRHEIVEIVTTLATLAVMMFLGPILGNNASMIQQIMKQVVPLIVTASVHYAADTAVPITPLDAPITDVQVEPVPVPQSEALRFI